MKIFITWLLAFYSTFYWCLCDYTPENTKSHLALSSIESNSYPNYDMELAEVNVFRPLFRYRASYAKKAQQFG